MARIGTASEMNDPGDHLRHTLDVTARTRTTVHEAERYTRFVGVMKRVLFIAGLALIAAVIAYALQPRAANRAIVTFKNTLGDASQLAMVKPRLTGVNTKGEPYVVTADRAVQDEKDLRKAVLSNVEADLTTDKGGWVTISAPNGHLDEKSHKLDIHGGISMFSDSGYEAHSDFANIDLSGGTVIGPHRVTGHGPFGTFIADHFRIERANSACNPKHAGKPDRRRSHKGQKTQPQCTVSEGLPDASTSKIFLIGNVHMTLYAKQKTPKGKKTK